MTPTLDIIIVSRQTRSVLLDCLASLAAHPPSVTHRVVVVDNASTDGTPDTVASAYPSVHLVRLDRNIGFGAANNVAARTSTASLVLFLNSDTLVRANAIDALLARLETTGAAAAGPRLVDGHGRPEVSFGPMLSPAAELVQRARTRAASSPGALARAYVRRRTSKERIVDWVSGACLLVRRDAGDAAGWFDERYFMYEEDVDFCAALRARGGRILFTPRAEIVHLRGRSRRTAGAAIDAAYDASHLAFYEKHAPHWMPLLRWWQRIRGR